MQTIQGYPPLETISRRRLARDLLAALALTLGTVAAPLLAGPAYADGSPARPVTPTGGARGGIVDNATASGTGTSRSGDATGGHGGNANGVVHGPTTAPAAGP